ncbi:MAG TPA: class I SAM-dependent methyltransferase [Pirellulales bacterium]|nr:class I SAM-dependent methyltransferase [Pirellulales bacterium]
MDTSGIKILAEDDIPYSTFADATHYQASNPLVFGAMLKSLGIDYRDFTFVDVGSGKGRTLLLAAQYGFKRIVGIEFDRQLHETAVRNVNQYRTTTGSRRQVECLHADGTRWAPATDKVVLYLFNPFGASCLAALLANVQESLKSGPANEIYVLYLHPVHEQVFAQFDVFSQVCRSEKHDFVVYATIPVRAA